MGRLRKQPEFDSRVLKVWNYIVMNIVPSIRDDGTYQFPGFRGIRFINASVMSVNPPWALHEDCEKEDELNGKSSDAVTDQYTVVRKDGNDSETKIPFTYIVYREYANAKKFTMNQDGCSIEWIFGSEIRSSTSIDKGSSLENKRSVLDIRFNVSQVLQTFYDYYGYVTTLLEFLTFRGAAPFEEIGLLYEHPEYGFVKFADCYVNTSTDIFANDSELGRRDAGIMTPEKIKSICSTLEVEMDAAGIKLNKGDELERLIKDIKNVIKGHRDSEDNGLPSKTYDNIFNSISHWGDSLADRAIEAWHQNEAFLWPWLRMLGIPVIEKDIAAVVKARNDITHRGFQNVDENIGQTAFVMIGIIYVLALKRLKVSDEIIKDLMTGRIVG